MRGRGGGDESGAAGRGAGGGCAGGGAGRSEVAVCCTLAGAVVVAAIATVASPTIAAIPAPPEGLIIVRCGLRLTRCLAQTRLPGLVF